MKIRVDQDYVAFEGGSPRINSEWYRADRCNATELTEADARRFAREIDGKLNGRGNARREAHHCIPVTVE